MDYVLITGASGGIARALALRLHNDGRTLAYVTRDPERLSGAPAAVVVKADLSCEGSAESALRDASKALGAAPSAVAHCMGSTLIAPIQRTSDAQYRSVMAANVDSAFFLARAYVALLSETKSPGSLLFFSSVVAGTGVANHAAIATAKGAIEALTRSLAADHAASGLRVNCIAPGLMRTPMTERMVANESSARQIAAQYPLAGMVKPRMRRSWQHS